MRYMMSAAAKPGLPKTGRMAYPGTGSPYHITAVREEGSPACIKVVREALGAYGREGYPLVLWLESADPFRGCFTSPALGREIRICFGSYAEFAGQVGELTEQVRILFWNGKRLETETWRLPPAGRRADRVLFIRPGRDGNWSGDIYTPGAMRLETFRNAAELEVRLRS